VYARFLGHKKAQEQRRHVFVETKSKSGNSRLQYKISESMGSGLTAHVKEQKERNRQIEAEMLNESRAAKNIIKLLLLGEKAHIFP